MLKGVIMNQQPSPIDEIHIFENENPPIKFGSKRLFYQYSVSIPQIQLVLVSVLQGIVFTVLLTRSIPIPHLAKAAFNLLQLSLLLQFFVQQYFYLPYILTSLILIIVWTNFVYASAVFVWPPTPLQAGLIYLITIVEVVMANAVLPE